MGQVERLSFWSDFFFFLRFLEITFIKTCNNRLYFYRRLNLWRPFGSTITTWKDFDTNFWYKFLMGISSQSPVQVFSFSVINQYSLLKYKQKYVYSNNKLSTKAHCQRSYTSFKSLTEFSILPPTHAVNFVAITSLKGWTYTQQQEKSVVLPVFSFPRGNPKYNLPSNLCSFKWLFYP